MCSHESRPQNTKNHLIFPLYKNFDRKKIATHFPFSRVFRPYLLHVEIKFGLTHGVFDSLSITLVQGRTGAGGTGKCRPFRYLERRERDNCGKWKVRDRKWVIVTSGSVMHEPLEKCDDSWGDGEVHRKRKRFRVLRCVVRCRSAKVAVQRRTKHGQLHEADDRKNTTAQQRKTAAELG